MMASTKWQAQHYNAIAKEIREIFPTDEIPVYSSEVAKIRAANMERRTVLTMLAISLARRFANDNQSFRPLKFLDACSPDTDAFPLSELWEEFYDVD